ncbi:hypothetical protein PCE1_003611 [Barthelona sp. PCE]
MLMSYFGMRDVIVVGVFVLACILGCVAANMIPLNAEAAQLIQQGFVQDPSSFLMTYRRGAESVVFKDKNPYYTTEAMQNRVCSLGPEACKANAGPLAALPRFMGKIKPDGKRYQLAEGKCFKTIKAGIVLHEKDRSAKITLRMTGPKGKSCSETFLFLTLTDWFTQWDFLHGTHTLTIKKLTTGEMKYIKQNGLVIFASNENFVETLSSLWNLATMFMGNAKEEHVLQFIKHDLGINLEKRPQPDFELDPSKVMSGDTFFMFSLDDGVDSIISSGTNSLIGHVATAMWVGETDGPAYTIDANGNVIENTKGKQLWIYESVDDVPFSDEPHLVGIVKTTYKDFLGKQDRSRHIAMSRLRSDLHMTYLDNLDKAQAFYNAHETKYYGYSNIAFTFLDLPSGIGNLPGGLSAELFGFVFRMAHKVKPKVIDMLLKEGLAWRTGLPLDTSLDRTFTEIENQGKTLAEIMAIIEPEDYPYTTGPVMVCSGLVTALFKSGGVFGDLDILYTEATPRDLFEMKIWKTNHFWGDVRCGNDGSGVCQTKGEFIFPLPNHNSIAPYNHMNERCPTWHRQGLKC